MNHITVATYNIRHGGDVAMNWSLLAEIIRESGADVIGLQEVDMGTNRIGGRDTVAGLREAVGFPHALFIPAMDFDGGQYGTAILSRYPIEKAEYHPLDAGGFEPRSFGYAAVELPSGTTLYVLNTHLSYESGEQQNIQFRQLAAWMGDNVPADQPIVLTGDFNTEDFTAFAPLTADGLALVNQAAHTYRSFRYPPLAIDNIVYRAACLTPVEHGMIDSDRSDHNLLWCRFELADGNL